MREENESWLWLKHGYLKKETEGLIIAAQDQTIRTNWIKRLIDKQDISQKCRICGDANETVSHIVAGCKLMTHKDYKISRHDKVAAIIHWERCKKYGFPHSLYAPSGPGHKSFRE